MGAWRRYDLYLDSAWRNDASSSGCGRPRKALPEYAGKTALIVTTDHGRGNTAENWTGHGEKVPESDQIWMAVMGPGVQALGTRAESASHNLRWRRRWQRCLAEDYNAAQPKAAGALKLN